MAIQICVKFTLNTKTSEKRWNQDVFKLYTIFFICFKFHFVLMVLLKRKYQTEYQTNFKI